jgi:raffinose/stachyose/melibiose transport system permease protein
MKASHVRAGAQKATAALVFTVIAVIVLVPFLMLVLGPFRTPTEVVTQGALGFPSSWDLTNLKEVLFEHNFARYTLNTLYITAPVVIFATFFALLSAFALSFMRFRLRIPITIIITVFGIMVSEEFIMIPLFGLMRNLGLIDTFIAAILPQLAMSAAFSTLLIWSFFAGLPRDFVDAALVSGATSWELLWQVLAPMATGPIASAVTLTTTWTWNDYIIPLVMLQSSSKATLPLGLAVFQGVHQTNIPLTMAGTLITALPMVMLFLIFQRQMSRGLLQGFSK